MSGTAVVGNTFASAVTATGAQLDANYSTIVAYLNDPTNRNNYAADAGTTNTVVTTFAPPVTGGYTAGLELTWKWAATNSGAVVLNANGLGNINVVNPDGSALWAGQGTQGGIGKAVYDGTRAIFISGATFGDYRSSQVYATSTVYVKASGLKRVRVTVVGGGGGSGGAAGTGSGEVAAGGGGAAGGASIKTIAAASLAATETVSIGAAGAAAVAGGSGGDGGTSSFGAHCSATGGGGGTGGGNSGGSGAGGIGGLGGVGSGGDLNISGQGGGTGIAFGGDNDNGIGGSGGSSIRGGGARPVTTGTTNDGDVGGAYGGGASGAVNGSAQAAQVGSAGAAGVVIVEEFF